MNTETEAGAGQVHEFVASRARADWYPRGYHRCLRCDRRRDEHDDAVIHRLASDTLPTEGSASVSRDDLTAHGRSVSASTTVSASDTPPDPFPLRNMPGSYAQQSARILSSDEHAVKEDYDIVGDTQDVPPELKDERRENSD